MGLNSSASELYQDWLAYMQATYPGYIPAAASLENIDALAMAGIMADVAQAGIIVPDAIFRALGTKLFGLLYLQGVSAVASVQVTAVDTAGYTLPAGTDLSLGVFGFTTQTDLTIAPGSSTGTVMAVATVPGVAYNGASNPTSFVSTVDWVSSVTALAPASGGIDAEDDIAYQNRFAGLLKLIKPSVVTAADFATMSLSFIPAAGTTQQEIGRATALDGYVQGAASFTVTTVNTNQTVTVTTPPGTGITAAPGASITGTGIPAGTIVQSSTSTTILMSNPATASGSGVTATVGGTLGNEKNVTVGVTLSDGTATNSATKTALTAWLESMREINFVANVIDPTYTPVYVTVSVHPYAGFDPTATQTAIQDALLAFLSPQNFGLAPFGNQAAWLAGTTIYTSQLAGLVQNAGAGAVQYIVDGSLKLGLASTPTGVLDLVLPGPLSLPTSTTSTITVTMV